MTGGTWLPRSNRRAARGYEVLPDDQGNRVEREHAWWRDADHALRLAPGQRGADGSPSAWEEPARGLLEDALALFVDADSELVTLEAAIAETRDLGEEIEMMHPHGTTLLAAVRAAVEELRTKLRGCGREPTPAVEPDDELLTALRKAIRHNAGRP